MTSCQYQQHQYRHYRHQRPTSYRYRDATAAAGGAAAAAAMAKRGGGTSGGGGGASAASAAVPGFSRGPPPSAGAATTTMRTRSPRQQHRHRQLVDVSETTTTASSASFPELTAKAAATDKKSRIRNHRDHQHFDDDTNDSAIFNNSGKKGGGSGSAVAVGSGGTAASTSTSCISTSFVSSTGSTASCDSFVRVEAAEVPSGAGAAIDFFFDGGGGGYGAFEFAAGAAQRRLGEGSSPANDDVDGSFLDPYLVPKQDLLAQKRRARIARQRARQQKHRQQEQHQQEQEDEEEQGGQLSPKLPFQFHNNPFRSRGGAGFGDCGPAAAALRQRRWPPSSPANGGRQFLLEDAEAAAAAAAADDEEESAFGQRPLAPPSGLFEQQQQEEDAVTVSASAASYSMIGVCCNAVYDGINDDGTGSHLYYWGVGYDGGGAAAAAAGGCGHLRNDRQLEAESPAAIPSQPQQPPQTILRIPTSSSAGRGEFAHHHRCRQETDEVSVPSQPPLHLRPYDDDSSSSSSSSEDITTNGYDDSASDASRYHDDGSMGSEQRYHHRKDRDDADRNGRQRAALKEVAYRRRQVDRIVDLELRRQRFRKFRGAAAADDAAATKKSKNLVLARAYLELGNAQVRTRDYANSQLSFQSAYRIYRNCSNHNSSKRQQHRQHQSSALGMALAMERLGTASILQASSASTPLPSLMSSRKKSVVDETGEDIKNNGFDAPPPPPPSPEECLRRAYTVLLEAFRIRNRVLGPHHVDTIDCFNAIAALHVQVNDLREAQRCYWQIFWVRKAVFGGHHPAVGVTAHNLANVFYLLGEPDNADNFFNIAMEIYDNMELGNENPAVARLLRDMKRLERIERLMFVPSKSRQQQLLVNDSNGFVRGGAICTNTAFS